MRDYSSSVEKKRFDDAAEKDRFLDLLGSEVSRRNLTSSQIRQLVPTISARTVSDIRQGLRSAGSLARLREIASALGILEDAA